MPDNSTPTEYKGAITQGIEIHFDLRDRLRILFNGELRVSVETRTAEPVKGHDQGEARIYTRPIWRKKSRIVGGAAYREEGEES